MKGRFFFLLKQQNNRESDNNTAKDKQTNLPVVACRYSRHLAQALALLPHILGDLAHSIPRLEIRLILNRRRILIQRVQRAVDAAGRSDRRRVSGGRRGGSLVSAGSLGRTQHGGNIQRRLGRANLARLGGHQDIC